MSRFKVRRIRSLGTLVAAAAVLGILLSGCANGYGYGYGYSRSALEGNAESPADQMYGDGGYAYDPYSYGYPPNYGPYYAPYPYGWYYPYSYGWYYPYPYFSFYYSYYPYYPYYPYYGHPSRSHRYFRGYGSVPPSGRSGTPPSVSPGSGRRF